MNNTTTLIGDLKVQLRTATEQENIEALRSFLAAHPALIDARYENGLTCLMIAAEKGLLEVAQILVAHGADLEAENSEYMTPLYIAIWEKQAKLVAYFLTQETNVNHRGFNKDTALFFTYKYLEREDFFATFELLMKKGLNVNAVNRAAFSLLMRVCQDDDEPEIVKLLLDNGANSNLVNNNGMTALTLAAQKAHINSVRLLLDKGANINQAVCAHENHKSSFTTSGSTEEGFSALMHAAHAGYNKAHAGHEAVVRLLIEKGADVNFQSKNTTLGTFEDCVFGRTALHIALEQKHETIAQILLDAGADPTIKNEAGVSPNDLLAKK